MIDLHCHILPGLDDGAGNTDQSIQMARVAAESGIGSICCTPHCMSGGAEAVFDGVANLQERLHRERIPVSLYVGMEIFGTQDTPWLLRDKRLLTLNGSRYPLIEFSFHTSGEREIEILAEVIAAGYRPVVAHPERYEYVRNDPRLINLWTDMGCLFQINRGSLLGRFGSGAQWMATELVQRGFATVIATDAHSPRVRTPRLADIRQMLQRQLEPTLVSALLERNPKRILKNEDVLLEEPVWF